MGTQVLHQCHHVSLEELRIRESGPLLCGVNGLGGSSNDQVVLKWFPPLSHDLFYCERTHWKKTGPHTTSPGPQAYLCKLVTCFLSIAPSLAAGREARRRRSETPAGVLAFGICMLSFTLRTTAVALQSSLALGSFLSPAVLALPHTCIITGGPVWHLCLLTTCTCVGHGPGLIA